MTDINNHNQDNSLTQHELMLFMSQSSEVKSMQNNLLRLGYDDKRVLTGGVQAGVKWCQAHLSPSVLLVDIDGDDMPMQSINELIDVCDPSCRIVVLGSAEDINLYRTLLQGGIFDYLLKPLAYDLLSNTIRRALGELHQDMSGVRSGRTIAVTGVSGGCGCSTVVTGLAKLLSEQRHMMTAVVDFDRVNGDIALLLGHEGDAGLEAALNSEVDNRFLQRSMGNVSERLHLLAQQPNFYAPKVADLNQLLNIGASLCSMFNQVIWDLPAGQSEENLAVLKHAQTRIILTDLTVQDARNTLRLLQEIGDESEGQQLLLVVNCSRTAQVAAVERKQFEEFVGRPIDFVLPNATQELSRSLLTGPLQFNQKSLFSMTLSDLADFSCGQAKRAVTKKQSKVSARIKSIFKKGRSHSVGRSNAV